MTKITEEMIERAYIICREVDENHMNKDIAIYKLVEAGWNKTSVTMTFPIYNKLMTGETYKWMMSGLQTEIFLKNILRDKKKIGLKLALISVKRHVEHYEREYGRDLLKIKKIYNKFKSQIQ